MEKEQETVTIKKESLTIKEEKPDDCEVPSVQTHTPQKVVFSFKTTDNDSVTVVKSEPDDEESSVTRISDTRAEADGQLKTLNKLSKESEGTKTKLEPNSPSGFGKEVQHVRCLEGPGNRVVILGLPKQQVKEIWDKGRVATVGSPCGKTPSQVTVNLTQVHRLRHVSSVMQHILHASAPCPKPKGPSQKIIVTNKTTELLSRKRNTIGTPAEVKKSKPYIPTAHDLQYMSALKVTPPVKVIAEAIETDIDPNSTATVVGPGGSTNSLEMQDTTKSRSGNILKCLFCGRKFAQMVSFKYHMKTHLERKPIQCSKCNTDFYFYSSLVEHYKKYHRKKIEYLCGLCKIHFSRADLQTHLLEHETRHQFVCGLCGEQPASDIELFEHVKQHENVTPMKCGVCFRIHVDFEILQYHLKQHFEDGQFICEMCEAKFKSAVEFSEHSKVHIGLFPYQCESCQKRYRNRAEFNNHRNHCAGRIADHQCLQCPARFLDKQELSVHYENCHQSHACNFCGEAFTLKDLLQEHIKTHKVVAHFI